MEMRFYRLGLRGVAVRGGGWVRGSDGGRGRAGWVS